MRLLDDAVDEAEKPPASGRRSGTNDRSLLRDERAVEGLPIRIVIAIIVGVAALGFMMALLGNVNPGPGQTELEANLQDEVIYTGDLSDGKEVTIEVMSEDGEPVTSGRVMVEAGTAQLAQPQVKDLSTNDGNEVTIEFTDSDETEVDLRSDQNSGTLSVSILPPSDSDYVDALENSEIVVIRGDSPS